MPSFVVFNGITRFAPGGITKINADALNQVLLSDNSVVALIGEADGGAPGSAGLVSLADPSRAAEIFRSGKLADAIRTAFQPSGDALVPGGASTVICYKTNNSTQSSIFLPGDEANEEVSSTATGGSTTTVIDTGLAGTVDDQYNGMTLVLRPFTATCEVRTITDYDSGTQTFTLDSTLSATAAASDAYVVLANTVPLVDAVDSGGSSSTTINFKDATFVADEFIGHWVFLVDTASNTYLRQITDNTTDTLTISPALPAAPTAGAYAEVLANQVELTSSDYGSHTNGITADQGAGVLSGSKVATISFEGEDEVSGDIGGFSFLKLLYRGGAEAIGDTAAASSTTTTINLTTGGLTPSAHVGQQVLINGEYTTITANTASDLTVSPALSAAPAATNPVSIRTLTAGTMTVGGASGVATGLTTTLTGVVGDDLNITFSTGQTLRNLVDTINQNVNYLATVPDGINADTTLVADFDFGPATEQTVLNSEELTASTVGLTQNCAQMVAYFNSISALVTASRPTGNTYDGSGFPADIGDPISLTGGTRGTSSNTDFQNGLDEVLKVRANSVVPLIDEDLVNEGNSSTATVASVAAQLKDHVIAARGAAGSERGGFIGFQGTKSEIIAQANSLNDTDVALCCQNPTITNASGSLQEFNPFMMAVMAAGMRAGVSEVGEPLTNKTLKVSGLSQDASWDPADTTDSNDMIKAGVMFAKTTAGVGTRWVRDITTYVKDNNLAFSEGSVRDAVRFIAYGLRTTLVDRFTGRKAAPATINAIKDTAATFLELARTNSIIVDSTDPATGATVRAYHNLKVTSSGDTVTIKVGIFPVPGINFTLNELFLQLPTQAA